MARDICLKRAIYVGNDINDVGAMALCGLSFCPGDAHPMIKKS